MHLRTYAPLALAAAIAAGLALAPQPAAAKVDACEFEELGLDADSLLATSSRPTITGVASTTRSVQVTITKEGAKKPYYTSKVLKVKRDEWSLKVPKKLKDGEYEVEVFCPRVKKGDVIATGTLVIGERAAPKADTQVTVTPIPLLQGGTADDGQSVPVAYLNVKNTGKTAVTVKGFWVKQNGTASDDAVDSFTVVDGTGLSRITTDDGLDDGKAFAKTDIVIPPKGFSLFTIKANLDSSLGSDSGESLKIDVTAVDGAAKTTGKMPIKGVTWTLR